MGTKKKFCYKCRYLVLFPDGFFKRKSNNGPCDRCLKQMTIFQQIDQNKIWLKFIPKEEKKKTNKKGDRRKP